MAKPQEFDLHGHTTSVQWWRRFDVVELNPREIVYLAAHVGLNGVAITDHNSISGLDLALETGAKNGVIVVPGVEISAFEGLAFAHILALGIDPDKVRHQRLPNSKSLEETADWIHSNGGIVVAPHPKFDGLRMGVIPASLSFKVLEENIHLFDAIQTHDIEMGFNQSADKIAVKYGKPRIGGSDFHLSEQVGIVRTKFLRPVISWQEVVEAIRQGQVEPFFSRNFTEDNLKAYKRSVLMRNRLSQFFG